MLAALLTPLSECSRGNKANALPPPAKTGWQKIFPRSDSHTDYDYGATRLDLSLGGALTLVAFAWPIGLAIVGRRVRGKRRAWLFHILEILLCAGSIYWIYAITEAGTRLWGAYFVFAIIGVYALATLRDLFGSVSGTSSRSPNSSAR